MKRLAALTSVFWLLALACGAPAAMPTLTPTLPLSQLLRNVAPSIVRIRSGDTEGTGFVAFQAGLVLTAFHVVGSTSSRPTVVAPGGIEYPAVVLGADEGVDLALLFVPALQAPPLALATEASAGESVSP